MRISLISLLKKYNLRLNKVNKPVTAWDLAIFDKTIFNSHIVSDTTKIKGTSLRVFYGEGDTLELDNIDSQLLAKTLNLNYNIEVYSSIDKYVRFSIKIPNINRKELNEFLKINYGLIISENIRKTEFVIIE